MLAERWLPRLQQLIWNKRRVVFDAVCSDVVMRSALDYWSVKYRSKGKTMIWVMHTWRRLAVANGAVSKSFADEELLIDEWVPETASQTQRGADKSWSVQRASSAEPHLNFRLSVTLIDWCIRGLRPLVTWPKSTDKVRWVEHSDLVDVTKDDEQLVGRMLGKCTRSYSVATKVKLSKIKTWVHSKSSA